MNRHALMVCLTLVTVWSATQAADKAHAPADKSVSSQVKATSVAAKHDAKAVGTAVKEDAEKVKIEAKRISHEVAEAARKGAHEVKVVAEEIADKTKQAVAHGTGDHSAKPHQP